MKDGVSEPRYQLDFVYVQDSLDSEREGLTVHLMNDDPQTGELLIYGSTSETSSQCDCDCDC